ncbi:hypothetical protein ACPPVU_20190 [Mucilaginibacter sp. McL0603]|uniref:hypothetical protein n=1 Tax=Mucilaginibacter sp. McL0603 TaxID=3415670 RepID=UPI003CEE15D2
MINIIKIYFWQFVSILFNFASIFVVTPYLASNPNLYGIYTLVTAAAIFLTYGDFGFLGAGMKYASECYAQKDLKQEIRIIGFTGFIFLSFVCLYAICVFLISFKPELLIKNLINTQQIQIAKWLLIILSVSSPVFMFQRVLQIIFAVRLKDYVFQKILICANAIKIIFAIMLFGHGGYPIVYYFLFSQVCSLLAVCIGFWVVKSKLGYDLRLLLKSLRFNKELYKRTSSLAFVSIFLTISWIIYYELDPFVISKLLGPQYIAIYAVGFTLMEYFRSVFGIIFSPFIAKFNYYVGLKDYEGLKKFFITVLIVALPLTVLPVLAISITIKTFILTWVGASYAASVPIAQVLVLSYLFSFIISPSGLLVMAYEKAKNLYLISALLPFIYWMGVFFTFRFIGLQSLADFKFFSFLVVASTYVVIIVKLLDLEFWSFLWKILLPALLPVCFLVAVLYLTKGVLPEEKSKINLFIYFVYNGAVISGGLIIYYFSSITFRKSINLLISPISSKINSIKSTKD